jgi:Tol biopolymer transport system component
MAPEQIRGGAVDARTDLYALGCVLYEMLVGKVPLPAPSAAQNLQRHLDDRPTDPRAARPEVPRWLGRLCLRLLAKDPALRPQSAAETLRALDGPRWRRPALAGAALLALLAGTLAASLALRPKEWRPAVEEMKPSYEENSDHADVSPDGKLVAYPSDRDGNWGIYLAPLKGGPSRRVTRPDDRATSPRFSRDGKWLMFRRLGSPGTANQSGLYRVALDAGAEPELIELGAIGDDCGGRLLLGFRATGRLVVREAGGDREVLHVPEGYRLAAELRCDPAGKRFVYGLRRIGSELHSGHDGEDGEIWIAPLDGGAARPLFPDRRYAREPTFAADGRSVIYAGRPLPNDGKINLWEIAVEGGAARQITSGEGPDFAPAIASDGSVLLYNVDVTSKPLYQRTPAGDSRRISHTLDYVTWPRVTPDGRQVVAAVARHGSSRIVAFAVDSGDERVLADGDTAALAPDGREVLYSVPPVAGERRTRVFAVPLAGGSPRAVTEVEGRVAGLYTGGDDRVHLEVVAGSDRSAWFAPLAGGAAAREVAAPWSAVIPAPAGGWRIVERRDAVGASEARFVPPGAPLDAPEGRPIHNLHIAWFPDGKSIVYQTQSEVRRCTVGGEDALLRRAENGGGVAVAPDGQTVYYSALLGHVRRELITNFAERPRPTGR